ncbi:MAG: MarR family winged helix-turn-helix transcriptional regulator [bacterium]
MDALRRLVRGLRLYARHCETVLGLSAAQLFALRSLKDHDGMSLRELAEATLTDLSSVSVVTERLRAKGLLDRKRNTRDRRRAELSLTPEGRAILLSGPDAPQERLVKALRLLSPERGRAFALDLRAVVEQAGLLGEPVKLFFEDES